MLNRATLLLLVACSSARLAGELRDRHTGESLGSFDVEEGSMLRRDGYCPTAASAGLVHLRKRIRVEPVHAQVGFDAEVRVQPELGCNDEVEWRQIGGPRLGDRMRVEAGTLVIRTHPIPDEALRGRVGVVALGPSQRGDYRFEARVGEVVVETRVIAAPTAAGLYQVATGADVYLEGVGAWALLARPDDSAAEIAGEDLARFRPDRFGTYLIEHAASGTQMSIQAGAYDEVPRDCGRVGCHQSEAEGWRETAHATTFRRGIEGELGTFEERCWSCHATGVDPGVHNGGLHDTAAGIGFSMGPLDEGTFEALPRRIRRHGSVWCSACHGPGRIVPPQFRWQYGAKFQVGVCARCHEVSEPNGDADHTSGHVEQWRRAAMSRFTRDLRDDDPALRPECTRCHSAQGYVEHARRGTTWTIDRGTVEPITCPTCHDPHSTENPYGLRVSGGELGRGAICATCHDVDGEMDAPHAPQTGLLTGRGARLASDAPGPHARAPQGCVTCHMAEPNREAGGHTFAVRSTSQRSSTGINPNACSSCHGGIQPEAIGDFAPRFERALTNARRALSDRLNVRGPCGRVATQVFEHEGTIRFLDASDRILGDCDDDGRMNERWPDASSLSAPLHDAAHDLLLVQRDGSHGRHNPAFAIRVLLAIEAAL